MNCWHLYLSFILIGMQSLHAMHGHITAVSLRKAHASPARIRPSLNAATIKTRTDVDMMVALTDVRFAAVPGYDTLKNRLYASLDTKTQQQIQGYAYEFEVAWYLEQVEKHTIRSFEQKYTHPVLSFTREIDIVTDFCAIECKNINWDAIQRSDYITAHVTKQFIEQGELVRAGLVGVPYFMVCSKNQIPFNWKVWFHQRSILYMEGPY